MTALKDIEKLHHNLEPFKRKCTKCGHSMYILPKHPKRVCRWCGSMNYFDEKEKFIEKLKNALKK